MTWGLQLCSSACKAPGTWNHEAFMQRTTSLAERITPGMMTDVCQSTTSFLRLVQWAMQRRQGRTRCAAHGGWARAPTLAAKGHDWSAIVSGRGRGGKDETAPGAVLGGECKCVCGFG